jgi:hypothetical protein
MNLKELISSMKTPKYKSKRYVGDTVYIAQVCTVEYHHFRAPEIPLSRTDYSRAEVGCSYSSYVEKRHMPLL